MIIPKNIKIGGINYRVEFIEPPPAPPLGKIANNGEINFAKGKISIDKNYNDDMKFQILLHEILHGIEYNNGMESTEQWLDTMASSLCQVFKDNKLLKE